MMVWVFVALGGAFGAMARFALSSWLSVGPGKFPLATFSANVIGCFVMGMIYVLVIEKQLLPMAWRPFIMVGFLGAFTTFSTFSLEALSLWQAQYFSMALTYLIATLLMTILAVFSGYTLSEFIFSK